MLVVIGQARTLALSHATTEAQLFSALLDDQRNAMGVYAADVAAQLTALGATAADTDIVRAITEDSVSATPGDVIGVVGVTTHIAATGGVVVDPPLTAMLAAAAHTKVPTVAIAGGVPWIVASAVIGESRGDVVAARRLAGRLVPDVVLVRDGTVLAAGTIAGGDTAAGVSLPAELANVVATPNRAQVISLAGHDVAVVGVDAGGGVRAVVSTAATGISDIDPAALLLGALTLVALLAVVVVVQADLHRPLRRLERAAAALAEGDFEAPMPHNLGDDAVGHLAATFEQTRRQLRAMLRASRARASIASEMNSPQPLRSALQHVCGILVSETSATAAMITVAGSEGGPAYAVTSSRHQIDAEALLHGDGVIAAAFGHARDGVKHGVSTDPGLVRAGFATLLAVPIRVGSKALGVVVVGNPPEDAPDGAADIAASAAEQVALVLERYRILAVVERQASTDDLTGLHNHRFFADHLSQQLAIAQRQRRSLSVLMLDIDFFKKLNDTHGHRAGDRALEEFAAVLTGSVRRSDLAARYGGEEFVVVMSDTSAGDAAQVAEKVRHAVEGLRVDIGDGEMVDFTVSIGAATYPDDSDTGDDLMALADEALYVAKRTGRNRVVSAGKKKEPPRTGAGALLRSSD